MNPGTQGALGSFLAMIGSHARGSSSAAGAAVEVAGEATTMRMNNAASPRAAARRKVFIFSPLKGK